MVPQVKAADADRLTKLYTAWFDGIPWSKCKISASNRPSLGSWCGWPWDSYNIKNCGLGAGLPWKTFEVVSEGCGPEDLVGDEMLPLFQVVWTKEGGMVDINAACDAAMAAYKKLSKK